MPALTRDPLGRPSPRLVPRFDRMSMKPAELRITLLLMIAISAVLGVNYWVVTRAPIAAPWEIVRGLPVVAGTAACIAMGLSGTRREIRSSSREVFEHARQWVLAASSTARPAPRDPDVQPFITPLRERIDELSSRADSLQV